MCLLREEASTIMRSPRRLHEFDRSMQDGQVEELEELP